MAGSILTPATLWEKFKIDVLPEAELIDEKTENGILTSRIYIDGQLTKKGRVKIFATVTRQADLLTMPAVVRVDGLKCDIEKDVDTAKYLAKQGYMVLSIDLGGKWGDKEHFTIYPEDVSFADYSNARGHLSEVETSADKTCWYEWGRALRYALAYLKNQSSVTKIGLLGVKSGSTVVWHAAATEDYLSCAVTVMGAGWSVYKGISKFSDDIEPQFSDETLKYVAGIEAQSYAKSVRCPMLTLVATNSPSYDCDRAYDTMARINNDLYKALDYSVNYVTGIDNAGLKNLAIFLDKYLKADKTVFLPLEPSIKCDIEDKKLLVTASVDANELESVYVFVAEGEYHAPNRSWKKLFPKAKKSLGKKTEEYYFDFSPSLGAGIACFFVKASYSNGFTISSNVIAKRFKEQEVEFRKKSGILYSGREKYAESIFCPSGFAEQREGEYVSQNKDEEVFVKGGPMGIDGVSAKDGLFTFRINSSGINPSGDSILMLDVYSKDEGTLTVKLFADYFGERVEYLATAKLLGGRVWQNVKFEVSKFKTAEGRPIKSLEPIQAIGFYVEGKYLLNNVLWI